MAIGTVVGKFHNKALKMKGINVDDYKKAKDEFIDLLKNKKINLTESN